MCTLFEWWTFHTRNSIKKAKSSARAESRVSCIFKKLENKVSTVDRLFRGEGEEGARGLLSLKYIAVRALDLFSRPCYTRGLFFLLLLSPRQSGSLARCGSVWGNTLFKQLRARNFPIYLGEEGRSRSPRIRQIEGGRCGM